jgi:hypothetical protein
MVGMGGAVATTGRAGQLARMADFAVVQSVARMAEVHEMPEGAPLVV